MSEELILVYAVGATLGAVVLLGFILTLLTFQVAGMRRQMHRFSAGTVCPADACKWANQRVPVERRHKAELARLTAEAKRAIDESFMAGLAARPQAPTNGAVKEEA